ncbi:MAG: hypothetical protein AAFS02_14700 [Pseudomonadota bacterium]
MAIWHHKPRNLPAKYYRYIGEIAARWNMVEVHLQEVIWHVLDLDPKRGRLLTYWPGAVRKLDVFRALSQPWIKNQLLTDKLRGIASEVDRLNRERNRYVHGVFGHEAGKPKELKLFNIKKTKHKILPIAEHKSADDIKQVAEDIAVLQTDLESIVALLRRSSQKPTN